MTDPAPEPDPSSAPASALEGVAAGGSALERAARTCQRAVGAGFHWKEARGALGKLEEEVEELKEVLPTDILKGAMTGSPNPIPPGRARDRIEDELGDVLMAAAFVGGYLGLDPEALCHRALDRFHARFRIMEEDLGGSFSDATMDEMLVAWTRAKRLLDGDAPAHREA
ncbi:Nucleoside triphosphate pyrophosphohydrolase [Planctomycetes bacterium Poly30]|uniref:Nucleoside triphosphate pyrophosphohydrolase n=1 Tax=Saltatorellus ferox TaxID=2528018 RepID=A0A518EQ27_9BACT|nr:Nucleoside triphosphate pyrophosphohydrolase [Planctomycetes bacterium Poly30]